MFWNSSLGQWTGFEVILTSSTIFVTSSLVHCFSCTDNDITFN